MRYVFGSTINTVVHLLITVQGGLSQLPLVLIWGGLGVAGVVAQYFHHTSWVPDQAVTLRIVGPVLICCVGSVMTVGLDENQFGVEYSSVI